MRVPTIKFMLIIAYGMGERNSNAAVVKPAPL